MKTVYSVWINLYDKNEEDNGFFGEIDAPGTGILETEDYDEICLSYNQVKGFAKRILEVYTEGSMEPKQYKVVVLVTKRNKFDSITEDFSVDENMSETVAYFDIEGDACDYIGSVYSYFD